MKQTRGFTLVELLVVVAIIALLVSILLPTLGRAKDLAKQAACQANLSAIGKGWVLYTAENGGFPPILPDIQNIYDDEADTEADLKMGEICQAENSGGKTGIGEGAQQNLCQLVRIGSVEWNVFLCPSMHTKEATRTADKKFGLGETVGGKKINYCDYGIHVPYVVLFRGNQNPFRMNMDGGIVVVGDRRSKGDPLEDWSRNHPDYGESLLCVDGCVKFSRDEGVDTTGTESKNTGGWGGNNVYTADSWEGEDMSDSGIFWIQREMDPPKLISFNTHTNAGSPAWAGSTRDTYLYSWPD